MKPSLLLFSFLAIATSCEASNLLNFFFGSGKNKNKKLNRILPAGHEKYIDDLEWPDTTPSTPPSVEKRERSFKDFDTAKSKIVPVNASSYDTIILDMPPNFVKPKQKRSLGKMANKVRKALAPKILQGFTELSEEGARELLKIKFHMQVVLDEEKLYDLMLTDSERIQSLKALREKFAEYDVLNEEINQNIKDATCLKDFLKIVLKFYNKVSKDLVLNDCIKAILASRVFTLQEWPEVFGMSYQEIFNFACLHDVPAVALDIVKERIEGVELAPGVLDAAEVGNHELVNELVHVIGEVHGTDRDSLYHSILHDLAIEQVFQ